LSQWLSEALLCLSAHMVIPATSSNHCHQILHL